MAYQGFTNYATWNVALWLDNEEGSYRYWQREAKDVADEYDTLDSASRELGRRLRSEIEDSVHDSRGYRDLPGFARDILGHAMADVNWEEIAEHMLAEYEFPDSGEDGDEDEDEPEDGENAED